MTEFTHGIQGAIKKLLTGSSIGLAIIYTLGHIVIAMSVVTLLTGASLWEAGTVALVEPTINGVWFYILHTGWKNYPPKSQRNFNGTQSKLSPRDEPRCLQIMAT